jgi:hypothetical protein
MLLPVLVLVHMLCFFSRLAVVAVRADLSSVQKPHLETLRPASKWVPLVA